MLSSIIFTYNTRSRVYNIHKSRFMCILNSPKFDAKIYKPQAGVASCKELALCLASLKFLKNLSTRVGVLEASVM